MTMKKYTDFLFEEVAQETQKVDNVAGEQTFDSNNDDTVQGTNPENDVVNKEKTDDSIEAKKQVSDDNVKEKDVEKNVATPDNEKTTQNVSNFYNNLKTSLSNSTEFTNRNISDVQKKNDEIKSFLNGDVTSTKNTTKPVMQTAAEKEKSKRQIEFSKDSTEQLNAKLKNPSYTKYKDEINAVLNARKIKSEVKQNTQNKEKVT